MSTKIYYAYESEHDLFDTLILLRALRDRLRQIKKEMVADWRLADETPAKVYEKIRKYTRSGENEVFNIKMDAVLYPFPGKVFVHFFGLERPMIELVERCTWLEDRSYWNNSDPPEDITDEEWEKRGEFWDDIFDRDPTPSKAGLTFSIMDQYDGYEVYQYLRELE